MHYKCKRCGHEGESRANKPRCGRCHSRRTNFVVKYVFDSGKEAEKANLPKKPSFNCPKPSPTGASLTEFHDWCLRRKDDLSQYRSKGKVYLYKKYLIECQYGLSHFK